MTIIRCTIHFSKIEQRAVTKKIRSRREKKERIVFVFVDTIIHFLYMCVGSFAERCYSSEEVLPM